jgi:uncharacterized delta-60 repeat protein
VRPILAALAALALLLVPAPALARPGDADASFATGGRTAFTVGTASAQVGGLALRPDGAALVSGIALTSDGDTATSVSALGATGALDASFAGDGSALLDPVPTTEAAPAGLALAPDGAAIVATTVRNESSNLLEVHVVRILPSGRPDPAFGRDGVAVLDFDGGNVRGQDVAIDPLGRILVAASTKRHTNPYMSAFRLTPDGRLDTTFAGGRVDLYMRARAGAILPRPGGGVILAGGTLRGWGNVAVVEADDTGQRVDEFSGGLSSTHLLRVSRNGTGARDMVFGPSRTLVVAAAVHPMGGPDQIAVVRLTPRGSLDTRFGNHGIFIARRSGRTLTVTSMARDGRGRLLVAGTVHDPATGGESALVLRLTPSGRLDRRFGSGGAVVRRLGKAPDTRFVDSQATAVAAAAGRVWVGGVAFDDTVDPVTDLGRAWPAVMRLAG